VYRQEEQTLQRELVLQKVLSIREPMSEETFRLLTSSSGLTGQEGKSLKSISPEEWAKRWPNFPPSEFRCKGLECQDKFFVHVSSDFLDRLQAARNDYGKPMVVDSGGRCSLYNLDLRKRGYKSVDGSAHTMTEDQPCEAADIICRHSSVRDEMGRALLEYFDRMGIANTFLHVDSDTEKPQDVIWVYS
jgi:zinc D-Ala-D-Ala carboxypeptidase